MRRIRKSLMALGVLGTSAVFLGGCEGTTVSGGASVGVYYDSMMWNDYYRPPPPPGRPHPPVRPQPPIAKPPVRPVHPVAPIHRPSPRAR